MKINTLSKLIAFMKQHEMWGDMSIDFKNIITEELWKYVEDSQIVDDNLCWVLILHGYWLNPLSIYAHHDHFFDTCLIYDDVRSATAHSSFVRVLKA